MRFSWREYPDAVATVTYTLYYENISDPRMYPVAVVISNEDDLNPSDKVMTIDMQGFNMTDCYSLDVTAKGGDLDVSFMSNNVTACPFASPTAVRP